MKNYDERIDKVFSQYLEQIECDDKLKESLNYSFLDGGKHLRFKLFASLLTDFGYDIEEYIEIGVAIEMIHLYSLIHDDLPAMDNDEYRRGKYSNHVVFGDDFAILTGDALLTHAFDIILNMSIDDELIVNVLKYVSKCSGIDKGMINGQVLDIQNEKTKTDITLSELDELYIQKTGRLFFLPLISALLIDGKTNSVEVIESFEVFAHKLGIFFQIQDDYLDKYGSFEQIGKLPDSDAGLGKKTYVDFYEETELKNYLRDYREELLEFTKPYKNLMKVVKNIIERRG